LLKKAHVVTARPVLDQHPVNDPPNVKERPLCRPTGDGRAGEQRHRGCSVLAVQRHMLDDEVSLADEVVLFEFGRPEVDFDGAQDRLQTLAALWSGRVVDHVSGYEVVQDGVVARPLPSEQLLNNVPWVTRVGPRHQLGPVSARSALVMPSGCPSGHWTSSMR
jgi:hypothetical protein